MALLTKAKPTRRSTVYLLRVNKLDFIVPKAGFDLLADGLPCRVYYTPRTKTLLSMELV